MEVNKMSIIKAAPKTKRVCARCTPEKLDAIHAACEARGVKITDVLETAINTFLCNTNLDNEITKELKSQLHARETTTTIWAAPSMF